MKRKTRNNILRYTVATVAVLVVMLIVILIGVGLDWISDKTGLPIYTTVTVAGIIYVIWIVGNSLNIKDDKEE